MNGDNAAPTMDARFCGQLGGFSIDVAFRAPAHGITALFGPSGCGKTTILRCVAGLQKLPGHFVLNGDVWQDERDFRPTHRRPIGYVFQEANLFPHLSVRSNLLYGHRRTVGRGEPESIRLEEVVELLGIGHLLNRAPANLSGGERQRVAVGRALLSQPRLLLMDEPLAALDRMSKDEILPYLERLHDALSVPVLYVSHDITEVERLADHLVLLKKGRLVASGPLQELQSDATLPIARLPDAGVSLSATVVAYDGEFGLTTLAVPGGQIQIPGELGALGAGHRIHIAAADVSLAMQPPPRSTVLNVLPARILKIERHDDVQTMVVVALGEGEQAETGARLLARVSRKSALALDLHIGQEIYAQIKGVALVSRDRQGIESSPIE